MSFHRYGNGVLALALVGPAAAMAQTTSSAQSAANGNLQEIVVTATRREETLLDVPISMAAYTQETLDIE